MSLLQLPDRKTCVFRGSVNTVHGENAVANGVIQLRLNASPPAAKPRIASLLSHINLFLQDSASRPSLVVIAELCRLVVTAYPYAARDVHDKVRLELGKLAQREASALVVKGTLDYDAWLQAVVDAAARWADRTLVLSSTLSYADTASRCQALDLEPMAAVAHQTFKGRVLENASIAKLTTAALLTAMTVARQGLNTSDVVLSATGTLARFECFSAYEPLLKEQSRTYYNNLMEESATAVLSSKMPAMDHVAKALSALRLEVAVARRNLPTFMWRSLEECVESAYKATQIDEITAFIAKNIAFDKNRALFVSALDLYSKLGQFELLGSGVALSVQQHLQAVISDPSQDHLMIDTVLNMRRFLDAVLRTFFESSAGISVSQQREMHDKIRVAFRNGIGSRQNAPAECIAKYLDTVMRQGQGSKTEAEFGLLLDEIIALVSYTKDKDIFKAFYSTALAKRLLLNKSASDDLERSMILKLQNEMGDEFTSGDTMLKDLQLSESLNRAFQLAKSKTPDLLQDPSHVTVNVLTESAWPSYPQLAKGWKLLLAPKLQQSLDVFTSWYGGQHKNRKLSWRHQLATVTLSANFPAGRYEINVSLFQALVLLQFNDEESLTVDEIGSRTGIETGELARTLQSLALGRKATRVLLKRPPGKDVHGSDRFAFNTKFNSDKIRFRINQLQQDLSAEESKQTSMQVLVDRTAILDAYVVKIMKGRKTMSLQQLVDAVIDSVHKLFPPDVKDIKRRVEDLIEREYLERDTDDKNLLLYLA